MKAPIWLLKPAILAMHAECIATHGGSDGLRDEGLLDSALARPVLLHHYEKATSGGSPRPTQWGSPRTTHSSTATSERHSSPQPCSSNATG